MVTDTLPNGVFYIVTSRPGDRLDRLQERLFSLPHEFFDLGPLDVSEVTSILHSAKSDISQAEIERVAEVSQGHPLYLRAVTSQLATDPTYDLRLIPRSIEGFFRNATTGIGSANAVLKDVLSVLCVSRTPLSLLQLGEIMDKTQREVFDLGIRPIRQFLIQLDGQYTFYHSRFHEFVMRTIVYEDELKVAHSKVANWLQRSENRRLEYRLESLAYHIFEAGNKGSLMRVIDRQFLAEKVRRLGYAVLEDVELWTRTLMEEEDPTVLDRCVALVEELRSIVGGDIVADAAKILHPYRSGPYSFRTRLLEPAISSIPGIDLYVGILPKAEVPADFIEIVPRGHCLWLAIGDAPSVGLKSAFVGRFVANLCHNLIIRSETKGLGAILEEINSTIQGHSYFERISMQCLEIDPRKGILRIASAGHPYPVHYSARRKKCDILPVRGELLGNISGLNFPSQTREEYRLTIGPGDFFVLATDRLTEDHVMSGDPYGYRFMRILEVGSEWSARDIGQAVLDDWRAHPREEDCGDDVSIIVAKITA